jgi:hypothetical protein
MSIIILQEEAAHLHEEYHLPPVILVEIPIAGVLLQHQDIHHQLTITSQVDQVITPLIAIEVLHILVKAAEQVEAHILHRVEVVPAIPVEAAVLDHLVSLQEVVADPHLLVLVRDHDLRVLPGVVADNRSI